MTFFFKNLHPVCPMQRLCFLQRQSHHTARLVFWGSGNFFGDPASDLVFAAFFPGGQGGASCAVQADASKRAKQGYTADYVFFAAKNS